MLKCGCLIGEARSREQGFATGKLRAMDAGGDRCIMGLGTETGWGPWGHKRHASLGQTVGDPSWDSCHPSVLMLKVTRLAF